MMDRDVINYTEFVPGRLYFETLREKKVLSYHRICYICLDDKSGFHYESFYDDFGPYNICKVQQFCKMLDMEMRYFKGRIVHYTHNDPDRRANCAFLTAAYAVLYMDVTPERANEILNYRNSVPYKQFRDASPSEPYYISMLDFLRALRKASDYGFFNFDDFNCMEYEILEMVEYGDMNWIVPNKFLAFCGPHAESGVNEDGHPQHAPEKYIEYFQKHNITTIIRLNKKQYSESMFTKYGFQHRDLHFADGSTPSDEIMREFLSICEKATGAIAVHCKAGLGRTGTLIACYIIKHYLFTAHEAIAWIRLCRPGSVIGHQQTWLEHKQAMLWREGNKHSHNFKSAKFRMHKQGIYSMRTAHLLDCITNSMMPKRHNSNLVSGIEKQVHSMQIQDGTSKATQKSRRVWKPESKLFPTDVIVALLDAPTRLRNNKVLNVASKTAATPTRLAVKRNGVSQKQIGMHRGSIKASSTLIQTKHTVTTATERCVSNRLLSLRFGVTKPAASSSATIIDASKDPSTNTWPPLTKTLSRRIASKKGQPRVEEEHHAVVPFEQVAGGQKTAKRGKRSLNFDKEKFSARTKVLRRSYPSTDVTAKNKLRLPSVNKKAQTP